MISYFRKIGKKNWIKFRIYLTYIDSLKPSNLFIARISLLPPKIPPTFNEVPPNAIAEIGLFKKYAVKVDRSVEKNFEAELAKKDKIWIVAKYAATFASYLLITNRGPKADKVINAMVNYAASTSEDACIHIVVKEG